MSNQMGGKYGHNGGSGALARVGAVSLALCVGVIVFESAACVVDAGPQACCHAPITNCPPGWQPGEPFWQCTGSTTGAFIVSSATFAGPGQQGNSTSTLVFKGSCTLSTKECGDGVNSCRDGGTFQDYCYDSVLGGGTCWGREGPG